MEPPERCDFCFLNCLLSGVEKGDLGGDLSTGDTEFSIPIWKGNVAQLQCFTEILQVIRVMQGMLVTIPGQSQCK